ncbi:helix-turn-helix domain-containing protein [Prescottella sp. D32]
MHVDGSAVNKMLANIILMPHTSVMSDKKNPLGPMGEAASMNVARWRTERGLSIAELSRRLTAIGRPIPPLGLSRIEKGDRRIDVDDLVALAIALEVSPNTLLMQGGTDGDREVHPTATITSTARELWFFLDGMRSLTDGGLDFVVHSQPEFLSPVPSLRRRTGKSIKPVLVNRQIESDGRNVSLQTGIGEASIFDAEGD